MNAFIRNQCEKELLSISKEIILIFDIDVEIESEAFDEGGLKEVWKFIGKNSNQITTLITLISIFIARIPVENKELTRLQIENLSLDNELKREELRKIRDTIRNDKLVSEDTLQNALDILDEDYKVNWRRSNFYKRLVTYPKIDKLSVQRLNFNNKPIEEAKTIKKSAFAYFILHSDNVASLIDDNAIIEIISPVLKKGNFNWKGLYNGKVISFEMSDKQFKNDVLDKKIEFMNGTAIRCVLQQNRQIDESGIIKVTQNRVLTVQEIIRGVDLAATNQSSQLRREKIAASGQFEINFGEHKRVLGNKEY
ncbi:hypothetical protein [Fibrisoma montanum]|nr:hypothetical protein [Fibrisoma montanum]